MYTFTELGKDQRKREDVEKGQWGHGNSCTVATGKKKGTRTTTPNHADETRPVQHSKAVGPGRRAGSPNPGAWQEAQPYPPAQGPTRRYGLPPPQGPDRRRGLPQAAACMGSHGRAILSHPQLTADSLPRTVPGRGEEPTRSE